MEADQIKKVVAIAICGAAVAKLKKNKKTQRKIWMKDWHQRRNEGKGLLNMLNNELLTEDPTSYHNFLRLDNETLEYLLGLVNPLISKQDTHLRESVSARNRLEVTLRFLATGESYRSLMYSTRIHESTISKFVPEVCHAIFQTLKVRFLKTPYTKEEWEKVAEGFKDLWQFPCCIGAIDGRHIKFRAPMSAGSFYYNYKGSNSIVLLALVDAHRRFLYVNVGVNGGVSDGGVFRDSGLSKALGNDSLGIPGPHLLEGCNNPVPYVIVADDAFPLTDHIMKPYPQRNLSYEKRIFNYRLSRARRIVENAFGILANRFRVLLNPINLNPEKVEIITLTCVVLHNLLTKDSVGEVNTSENLEILQQPEGLLNQQGANRPSLNALSIRDGFKNYFSSPNGSVPWQDEAVKNFNM